MKIIIPIPATDFDPSEVAVTWKALHRAQHVVDFATPDGSVGRADPLMISGEGLDPWGWVPGLRRLRLLGLLLRADHRARSAYAELLNDRHFLHPRRYQDLRVHDYDALVLPGGHAKGMRPYLESPILQAFVADFFEQPGKAGANRPIAAICHGVLLAARSKSRTSGRSVLYGRRTTALTWKLEKSAWDLSRYLVRYWDPGYYRTYEESAGEVPGHWGVEQEVKRALASAADFLDVPVDAPHRFRKTSGLLRDSPADDRPAWTVRDGKYLSARWPGDVHCFAAQMVAMLAEQDDRSESHG